MVPIQHTLKTGSANYERFITRFPQFEETAILDELRHTDYSRLDEQEQVYLDFTGGNLYALRQIEQHHQLLREHVFGNPHSSNPTSMLSTKLVEEAREYVLRYFQAKDDYVCIFTPNASGALKIVGECYPFDQNAQFLLTFDNHNSVNGIREFARNKGAETTYCGLNIETLRINEEEVFEKLSAFPEKENKLFAFPAQSNVSGVKHLLDWIEYAQLKGWDVLLDAAAFVPSDRLDLSVYKPDFVSISFYKIFGYPTGLGCLLVRKPVWKKLKKPWFAGGTVTLASVIADSFFLDHSHAKFEDGTINYLDIPAIKIGLEYIDSIGIETIKTRVLSLTGWLLEELPKITHSNGLPVVHIFGPKDLRQRGGTIIMNFFDSEGNVYPFEEVEKKANSLDISIRTGCFCNPGIDEINNCLTTDELAQYFHSHESGNYYDMIATIGKMRGAVRISVGLISNFADIEIFINFVRSFANKSARA
ncbi:MAG: aminotransferase class V-fold PLP-dependent enzyme [Bacteroidia bacterium]|nr:aminotransferase class V-fold PLP-dependent enzyme [Bacteroidia bacterium]